MDPVAFVNGLWLAHRRRYHKRHHRSPYKGHRHPTRKGTIHKAIIVRTSVKNRGLDKSTLFFSNSVVLVKVNGNDYLPIGSRIKGPISSELKGKVGCGKILALGNKII